MFALACSLVWQSSNWAVFVPSQASQRAVPGPSCCIALTREKGRNGKLRAALEDALGDWKTWAHLVELPIVQHVKIEVDQLEALLATGRPFDTVVLASPTAAEVFLSAYARTDRTGSALPHIACVGGGTSAVLERAGFTVAFEPSRADASTLAAELPASLGPRVLYPCSVLALSTLEDGLASRGFVVLRLNTYTTQAVQRPSMDMIALMEGVDIATFGSPSSVEAWVGLVASRPIAACMGATTERAARAAGFRRIFAPASPGVGGWADSAAQAVRELLSI